MQLNCSQDKRTNLVETLESLIVFATVENGWTVNFFSVFLGCVASLPVALLLAFFLLIFFCVGGEAGGGEGEGKGTDSLTAFLSSGVRYTAVLLP